MDPSLFLYLARPYLYGLAAVLVGLGGWWVFG